MNAAAIDQVERLLDIASGRFAPEPRDVEHRKFKRRACRLRLAVLPIGDALPRQAIAVTTNDVSAGGFSGTGRVPLGAGTRCAVLLPDDDGCTTAVGAFVVHGTPRGDGRWEYGFQFTNAPTGVGVSHLTHHA